MLADELHYLFEGRAGLKHRGHPLALQRFGVLIWDDTADDNQDIGHLFLAKQFHKARHNRIVRAGQNRKPDYLHVLLQGGAYDHLRRLPETSINDFHPGVAERPRYDLGSSIMAVKARLCHEDSNGMAHSNDNCALTIG